MKDETRQGETDKTGQCRSLMKQRSICIGYPLSRAPILYSTSQSTKCCHSNGLWIHEFGSQDDRDVNCANLDNFIIFRTLIKHTDGDIKETKETINSHLSGVFKSISGVSGIPIHNPRGPITIVNPSFQKAPFTIISLGRDPPLKRNRKYWRLCKMQMQFLRPFYFPGT